MQCVLFHLLLQHCCQALEDGDHIPPQTPASSGEGLAGLDAAGVGQEEGGLAAKEPPCLGELCLQQLKTRLQ